MKRQREARHGGTSSGVAEELATLLLAGDHGGAASLARRCLSVEGSSAGDREAARAALARLRPDPVVALVAGGGLVLFVVVALLTVAAGR